MMATLDQAEDFYQGKTSVSPEDSEDTKKSPRSSLNSVTHRSSVSLTSLQNKFSKNFDEMCTEINDFYACVEILGYSVFSIPSLERPRVAKARSPNIDTWATQNQTVTDNQ